MKSKRKILRDNYFLIKEKFGDLISISELATFCNIHRRTIERYLVDNFIFSCKIEGRKRAIIVDSLLPDFKLPSKNNFHNLIKNREIYCKEKDFLGNLGLCDFEKIKELKLKKVTFQNKTLICMISLNTLLLENDCCSVGVSL